MGKYMVECDWCKNIYELGEFCCPVCQQQEYSEIEEVEDGNE